MKTLPALAGCIVLFAAWGCGGATGPTSPRIEADDGLVRIVHASRGAGAIDLVRSGSVERTAMPFGESDPPGAQPARVVPNSVQTWIARRSSDATPLASATLDVARNRNYALVYTGVIGTVDVPALRVLEVNRTELGDGRPRMVFIHASPRANDTVDFWVTPVGSLYPAVPVLDDIPRYVPSTPLPYAAGSYKVRITVPTGLGTLAEVTVPMEAGKSYAIVATENTPGTGSAIRVIPFQASPIP